MSNFIRPCQGVITSPYGMRIHPKFKDRRMHWGVDFGNTPGNNNIVAVAPGRVIQSADIGGYGNVVYIEHTINGQKYTTVYAHLASRAVGIGQVVTQRQVIGVKGTTGDSTGIHLHFELHVGGKSGNNNTVDPMMWLPLEVTVKRGDKGPNVSEIQRKLVAAGFKTAVDGSFGPDMEKAVRAFQASKKLAVDGLVGPATQKVLNEVKVVVVVLKYGDKGPAVLELQKKLVKAGFPVALDSSFGPATEKAVRAFQKARGLVVDGIAGPLTMAKLN